MVNETKADVVDQVNKQIDWKLESASPMLDRTARRWPGAVSYTHLTLSTIYSV